MAREKLYFIAIIPPQPHKEKIAAIKQSFAETYHVSHALKSPPHITLIPPFKMNESKEKQVTLFMEKFVENATSFQLAVEDYGSFKPRVIFLKPILSELFIGLYESISSEFYASFPIDEPSKRPFHPHLTIAFRDLKPNIFYKAWDELKSKRFKAEFIIDRIFLLKHDGRKWQEFREFIFRHCQLPA